jgi:DNA-binding PadR family transcriptional regulator
MSLRHAILGLLAHSPMTGYDLRKSIAQSVGHFWTADQAQIYRTLASLVQDNLVSVETLHQDDKPNRRLHSILPTGEVELNDWLNTPLQHVPIREPFLLKIFLGGRQGSGSILKLLRSRIDEADEMIATLTAIKAHFNNDSPPDLQTRLHLATLENGLAHARAEREWAHKLSLEIQSEFDDE